MTLISNEFDNLTGVSDTKDFEQSKTKALNVFDVPQSYQEFDTVESEIEKGLHSIGEMSSFANKLKAARVINRDDALSLESIIGTLEQLPHINSYTKEYSLVNYEVTCENVFVNISKFVAKVAMAIWKFIMDTIDYVKDYYVRVFKKDTIVTNPAKQHKLSTTIAKTKEAVVASQPTVIEKVKVLTPEQEAARNVRINKQLRALLDRKFSNLASLGRSGPVNAVLLVDEICEQQLKPFYTVFLNALYERDPDIKYLIKLYSQVMSDGFQHMSAKLVEVFGGDVTQPPPAVYHKQFNTVPTQLTDFLTKYGNVAALPQKVPDSEQWRITAIEVFETAKRITSIATVIDLPEPRALLAIDVEWIGDVFADSNMSIERELKITYDTVKRNYRELQKDFNTMDPDVKANMKASYSDWMVLNKVCFTLAIFRARAEAIMNNTEVTLDYASKAIDIINS